MRVYVEWIVYVCMFTALYYNLTNIPLTQSKREVRGLLEKVQNEFPN